MVEAAKPEESPTARIDSEKYYSALLLPTPRLLLESRKWSGSRFRAMLSFHVACEERFEKGSMGFFRSVETLCAEANLTKGARPFRVPDPIHRDQGWLILG
jgi:hypothetical protein